MKIFSLLKMTSWKNVYGRNSMKKKEKVVPKTKRLRILRSKCWEAMSLFTRLKWADAKGFSKCVTCGKRLHYKQLNAGHFIHGTPSHCYKFDYNEFIVNPQCVRCNKWLHGNLINYVTFITLKYGAEMVKQLQLEAARKYKLTEEELIKLLPELEAKVIKAQHGEYNVI